MTDDGAMSRDAQRLLHELARQMAPSKQEGAHAFDRLADAMVERPRNELAAYLAAAFRRACVHISRIAIPVIAIAAIVLFFRSIARDDVGLGAGLQDARLMLHARRYRGAYEALAKHAQRFKTREAAEVRTPLVLDALCGMRDPARAAAHLERFLVKLPNSALAERRNDICPLGTERARRLKEP